METVEQAKAQHKNIKSNSTGIGRRLAKKTKKGKIKMSEKLVHAIIGAFGGLTALKFGKEIVVFIISLLPILELRGGLIAASILKIPFLRALIICLIGNILPTPFILLFLNYIFDLLSKWKATKKLVDWLKNKTLKKRETIDKYGYLGILLFVGIPLPGTGMWTGSMLVVLLGLDRKKSIPYIILGILMASVIMSIVSYGILGNLIH